MVLIAGPADLTGFTPRPASTGEDMGQERVLDGWAVERLDENALTLDLARFRRGAEPFSSLAPVIAIQQVLNDGHYDGVLTLRYSFTSAVTPHGDDAVRIVVEHPERCTVRVNSHVVAESGLSHWRDVRWR